MLGLGVAVEMTMLLWRPAYLEQATGIPRAAAITFASAFPAAMMLGRAAGSVLLRCVAPTVMYSATLCLIVPGFLAFWGSVPAPIVVSGMFVAGVAIALYPLSLSFAVGAAGAAGIAAIARSGLAAGTAVLIAPITLGAVADHVGLSRAYLTAPILAAAILYCCAAARAMERRGDYATRTEDDPRGLRWGRSSNHTTAAGQREERA